jgi:hypothetical protein
MKKQFPINHCEKAISYQQTMRSTTNAEGRSPARLRVGALALAVALFLTAGHSVPVLGASAAGETTGRDTGFPGELRNQKIRKEGNPNPGVAPRHSSPYGKTYEEWAVAYRLWQSGIPAARNPALDVTGEFCGEEQSGPVWFLATTLGATDPIVRECHVPAGKALYVPLMALFAWGPDDIPDLIFILEAMAGIDTSTLTDEEILRAFVNWVIDDVIDLTLVVDGVPYQDLFSYRAESPVFNTPDTALYDDLGIPFSHPNISVTDGFALILTPLSRGAHTIEIGMEIDSPLIGNVVRSITYHLHVGP